MPGPNGSSRRLSPDWLQRDLILGSDLGPWEKWVLFAFLDSDRDGAGNVLYPSIEYVAWQTSLSRSTVQRVVGQLCRRKVLEPVGHVASRYGLRGRTVKYVFHPEKLPQRPSWKEFKAEKGDRASETGSVSDRASETGSVTEPPPFEGDRAHKAGSVSERQSLKSPSTELQIEADRASPGLTIVRTIVPDRTSTDAAASGPATAAGDDGGPLPFDVQATIAAQYHRDGVPPTSAPTFNQLLRLAFGVWDGFPEPQPLDVFTEAVKEAAGALPGFDYTAEMGRLHMAVSRVMLIRGRHVAMPKPVTPRRPPPPPIPADACDIDAAKARGWYTPPAGPLAALVDDFAGLGQIAGGFDAAKLKSSYSRP